MRAVACLLLLALAGCTSGDGTDSPATQATEGLVTDNGATSSSGDPDMSAASDAFRLDVNGTLWLPPTQSSAMTESKVPFRLNATADVHVTLHLASTMTPFATARAVVGLRDAAGNVLAEAEFSPPGFEPNVKTLDADGALAGEYELHFSTYGGSDGSANGDYIDYRIEAN